MTDHPPPLSPSFSSSFSRSLSLSSNSSPFSSPCSSSLSENAAFVPFLWETRPGISKGQTERKKLQECSSFHRAVAVSSDVFSPSGQPLRLPPYLQHASRIQASHFERDNVLSQGFQHRKIKSRDDPFLLAMEACKKAERNASNPVTSNVAAKLRKKKDQCGSLLRQEKEALRNMLRASSCKSLSTEHDHDLVPFAQISDLMYGVEKSTVHKNRPNGSRASRRNFHVASEELKTRKCSKEDTTARSRATDKQADIFCPSLSKSRFVSTRKKSSQSVHLSCGRHRRPIATRANRQVIRDWFSCRNGQSFSLIHPSRN